jgi:alpha-beta hydrolase superfamily lysophospholipase
VPNAASEPQESAPRSRWPRARWIAAAAAAAALLLALGALISWHFSSVALAPDHSDWSEQVDVEAVAPGRIELRRSEAASRPGYYGLTWQGGHAVVGPVQDEETGIVSRKLTSVRGYLAPGTDAGLETSVYAGDPTEALGLPHRTVGVPDPLGPMPAWLIPPARHGANAAPGTWALVVHGHNDSRLAGLRIAPDLRRAGITSLLISYRNDLGAPKSPDGLYHLGETEWQDLGAAARYALQHGARHLILAGYSMGGALITQFMQRSPLAPHVSAIVLDAPVLNWKSVIEFNSEQMGLPGALGLPVEWAIGARIDPDWDSLDALEHPGDLHVPILLFHGIDDTVVPIADSDQFAEELGKRVTYYRVPKADHTQEWNVDPRLYERRLRRFLLQISPKHNEPDRADRARSK